MSRRPQVLFLLALVGVLAVVGTVLGDLLGRAVGLVYAVVAIGLLLFGAARGRAAQSSRRAAAGRSCTCCTTSHFDPVKVI